MFGCRRNHRGSWRGRRGRDEAARPDPRRTEDMIAFVEQHLGITAEQREVWERLTETVRDSAEAMQIARGVVDKEAPGALQRFDGFEAAAEVASAALRRIRPALQSFHETLDAGQRKTLDDLMSHGPRHLYGAGVTGFSEPDHPFDER